MRAGQKDKTENCVSVGSLSEVPGLSLPKLGYGLLTKLTSREPLFFKKRNLQEKKVTCLSVYQESEGYGSNFPVDESEIVFLARVAKL